MASPGDGMSYFGSISIIPYRISRTRRKFR
nr:MAG TPA: hypothetical protein [Caudoviricetes sp.]